MLQHAFPDQNLFLRVIDLGSLRAAAREAGLEPSSVSRRITSLETRLGTKLLDRAQGAARPTEAGQRYADRLRGLLAQMDTLETEIAGEADTPRGLLRVAAAIDFGQRHVAPWLLRFRADHPQVEIELSLSARNVDLVATGTDVAIRAGPQPDSVLRARRLGALPRVLVASPAYLDRMGRPAAPEGLTDFDHIFFQPEHRHRPLTLNHPGGRKVSVQRKGGVTVNAIQSCVEAVIAGAGLHHGPLWAFHDALTEGRVEQVLPDWSSPAFPLYAVWAPAVVMPARIRAFVDFAARAARDIPGVTMGD